MPRDLETSDIVHNLNKIANIDGLDPTKLNLIHQIMSDIDRTSQDRFSHLLALYKSGLVDVVIEEDQWSKVAWKVRFVRTNVTTALSNLLKTVDD